MDSCKQKIKEQTIELTKWFESKGNTPKINKLKAELTTVINEGYISEEILNIESQIKELVDKDVVKALKNRKNYNSLLGRSTRGVFKHEFGKKVLLQYL